MSDERQKTREVKQQAKSDLESGKQRAQEAAKDVTEQGKEKLMEHSDRAASGVDDFADAVGSAASRLSELEHEGLADYANQLSSFLSDMSETLRNKNVDDLARDVRDIAQRNPALFLLGSVAVGLGLSRFAKASSQPRRRTEIGGDREWRGESEWRGDDEWRGYGDEDFISDVARPEDPSTDGQMTPDRTGGSGL
ncbi:MAG TPA: hypothetical protein VKZ91_08930 [Woeseiaceae bacterium]|nr:hypothetical protein [Woeseiaceae bacterium]